jgi:hypothetical protein
MFIKFHVDADSFHCYETSRPICALARLEVTFYWVNHIGWVHEEACEIITSWLKNERHQAGYQIDLVKTQALFERNGYMKALANPQ